MTDPTPSKRYKLLAPDGSTYGSETPGTFGGNKGNKRDLIYGRLDCPSAIRHLPGYAKVRVFFADEAAAIAAGYRPCYVCMQGRYRAWKRGGVPKTAEYPWYRVPKTEGGG